MVYYEELNSYVKELEDLRDDYLNDWDLFDEGRRLRVDLEEATSSKDSGYICHLYEYWIDSDRPEEYRVMTGKQKQAALFWEAAYCERKAKRLLNCAEELRIEAHKYN